MNVKELKNGMFVDMSTQSGIYRDVWVSAQVCGINEESVNFTKVCENAILMLELTRNEDGSLSDSRGHRVLLRKTELR